MHSDAAYYAFYTMVTVEYMMFHLMYVAHVNLSFSSKKKNEKFNPIIQ